MVTGLTKAFLGVGDNGKELSFSDHTHNLPDLEGILTADKGGTGVGSLDDLKTTLGIQSTGYDMKFQVADYWRFSRYYIEVPMNVFAGIWFNNGISMFIKLRTPGQSKYYYYGVAPDEINSGDFTETTTEGGSYILAGIYGIFWYPV